MSNAWRCLPGTVRRMRAAPACACRTWAGTHCKSRRARVALARRHRARRAAYFVHSYAGRLGADGVACLHPRQPSRGGRARQRGRRAVPPGAFGAGRCAVARQFPEASRIGVSMNFTIYPAIDVRAGRVVRLRRAITHARPATPPIRSRWRCATPMPARAGCTWSIWTPRAAGGYTLGPLLRRHRRDDRRLQVQTGGGVRDEDDVLRCSMPGASRVVVGSLAVREPASGRGVARALRRRAHHARTGHAPGCGRALAAAGAWLDRTRDSRSARPAAVLRDSGLRHLLCTDIARDGMLSGPNLALYRHPARSRHGCRCRRRAACATWPTCVRRRRVAPACPRRALLEGG
jgi:phosphoribosylformimino-5-aminoimidazole carboxamide ribotide isomerase